MLDGLHFSTTYMYTVCPTDHNRPPESAKECTHELSSCVHRGCDAITPSQSKQTVHKGFNLQAPRKVQEPATDCFTPTVEKYIAQLTRYMHVLHEHSQLYHPKTPTSCTSLLQLSWRSKPVTSSLSHVHTNNACSTHLTNKANVHDHQSGQANCRHSTSKIVLSPTNEHFHVLLPVHVLLWYTQVYLPPTCRHTCLYPVQGQTILRMCNCLGPEDTSCNPQSYHNQDSIVRTLHTSKDFQCCSWSYMYIYRHELIIPQ